MVTPVAYVGTSTEKTSEGIYSYRYDDTSGRLTRRGSGWGAPKPTFLAATPSEEYLFAINTVEDGTVTAFAIDADTGDLQRLNRQSSGGPTPCHVSVDPSGSYVLAANYQGGSVAMLPIEAEGHVGKPTDVIQHTGSGPNPDRQTEPHPHSITPAPNGRFAYAPDLGTDEVVIYEIDRENDRLRPVDGGPYSVHPGAGPRHLDFHPNGRYVYVINELDSTLVALEQDQETGLFREITTLDTLPPSVEVENYPSDVNVHPSGRWLYGANRGHDSICIFEIDPNSGRPSPIDHESTRGAWPRHFALSPDGSYLYVENENSNTIVSFAIDESTGTLDATGHVESVPNPMCLQFVSTPSVTDR